jgi:hypothetical protein
MGLSPEYLGLLRASINSSPEWKHERLFKQAFVSMASGYKVLVDDNFHYTERNFADILESLK